ncbi:MULTISPECIES: CinA family protein [unclassified Microbacterium]|jgi:nicotinamide-nucleotide amidase|uniref:CinA family protein n=1 Tax=unclassified Microbacterium TaxID=2609290 RepID=UPI000F885C09|nr:CinA family protein [Microbacterium sp. HSID17254]MPT14933.1 CinA family protein [Microbacterium sp.]RUQ08101.1 CinA family protein [Microbacterium sp. HSID17254]
MSGTTPAEALEALRERGWTLGVAESLTGGAVCAALVAVPGASAVLLGGVVAYATPVKHTLLGVDTELLERYGPVHPEVARQMAAGVREAVGVDGLPADVGVSTTGIAGPESPDGQPVGTVHIGVVTPTVSRTRPFRFEGDRDAVRAQTVAAVLDVLAAALRE